MALTLEQIARLAGVSLTTASRVINEQPNVRPEVRERVWQVIHEQGYQPNLALWHRNAPTTTALKIRLRKSPPQPPRSRIFV
jgi:DNA-binding LacI/PurR family transcriptional regulator